MSTFKRGQRKNHNPPATWDSLRAEAKAASTSNAQAVTQSPAVQKIASAVRAFHNDGVDPMKESLETYPEPAKITKALTVVISETSAITNVVGPVNGGNKYAGWGYSTGIDEFRHNLRLIGEQASSVLVLAQYSAWKAIASGQPPRPVHSGNGLGATMVQAFMAQKSHGWNAAEFAKKPKRNPRASVRTAESRAAAASNATAPTPAN